MTNFIYSITRYNILLLKATLLLIITYSNNVTATEIPASSDWTDVGIILEQGPPGTWDTNFKGMISPSTVIKKNGTYFLYYIGADGFRADGGPSNRKLGVATSKDGINFTKYSGNPVLEATNQTNSDAGIFSAGAMLDDNGDILLYYSDCDGIVNCDVRLAISSDGINFTDGGVALHWNSDIWGGGDELIPLGAYKYSGNYYVYYIAQSASTLWDLGVAWGSQRTNLTNSKAVLTEGSYVIGGANPMWLSPDQIALFILRDFSTRTVEVRTTTPDAPELLSSPVTTYNFSDLTHMCIFHDNDTNTTFMYYLNGTFDAIRAKVTNTNSGSISPPLPDTLPPSSPTALRVD